MKRRFTLSLLFASLLAVTPSASAAIVDWSVADGGNGHSYEVVHDSAVTWPQAKAAAESKGGYLATITSAAENLWITSTFGYPNLNAHFLGGFQPPNSPEPLGDWTWVTGEAWSYANWGPGEPNNSLVGEEEDALEFGHGPNADGGQWNDIRNFWTRAGYVVEYDPVATNPEPIPEASSAFLFGVGLLGLVGWQYRRRSGVATESWTV